mmetsp:Transcript_3400/g.6507  ORF Transcript_3400/g.6507 Transcript_3400/m.6507 type:complete len:673 (+) Transcript_3400:164-2182(+)|eukprot:CAMPEP_0203764136 /NCGR_PEP_ID=MMETSP0098-20131031/17454_1 /ASSEMBLY_ACC=CAM_ASM_000208 /TAXON_ID=96639 /ORGANISM=" , Strain NY0313808BC1" /LENGTH=672 /DNA_ID=CAMNT_0050659847 /DNA_START=113 /DNA_END=2131 /DNA_ORIENTATION=+
MAANAGQGVKKRKRKNSQTNSKGKQLTKAELIRHVRLVFLNLKLHHQRRAGSLVLFLLLCLNVFYFSPVKSGLRINVSVEKSLMNESTPLAEPSDPFDLILSKVGGFGAPVTNEGAILTQNSIKNVAVTTNVKELARSLVAIETEMNQGWNQSNAKVLPLGQMGYVKRDLPVYKDGLQKMEMSLLSRPKSGLYSKNELASSAYNMILCLSFNTDHCFDPDQYAAIGKSRKVNRLQALRDVAWSKDKFCKTTSATTRGIKDEDLLSFTFPCWVMPGDYDRMLRYSREKKVERWIVKPRSLGAGMGIYVVNDYDGLSSEKHSSNVIQTYLEEPHLIEKVGLDGEVNKYKWDMRTYVLVTSITPLRAYVFNRGLVRISTSPYTKDCSKNITACLTNTSLNKKVEGAQLKDITWSFKKLKDYLATKGMSNFDAVYQKMQRAIGLTLMSTESEFMRRFTPKGFKCENCYQLLGVDLLFDKDMNPKVVEINGEPSLKLTGNGKTHYDFTKRYMGRDLFELVFNKRSAVTKANAADKLATWAAALAQNEKQRKKKVAMLGEDHVQYILATLREHSKLGGFMPVYPNRALASTYARFLQQIRDYEDKNKEKKPINVHGDGRRYRLHQIITVLQSPELASISSQLVEDPAPSTTATSIGDKKPKQKSPKPESVAGDDDDEF